jgi:hypothetical protein
MQISKKTKTLFKSFFILLSISILGGILGFLLNFSFIVTFLSLLIFQIILFSFIGSIIQGYNFKKIREKELDRLQGLSTLLSCAYCNKPNIMIFDPNETERIEFVCDHCQKKNLVNIQFFVSQISEPLEIPKVVGIPSESLENS